MSRSPRKSTNPAGPSPVSPTSAARTAGAPSEPVRPRPRVLAVVCLVVLVQAALLVGLGGAWVADLVRGASQLPGATVFLVLFALGIAAALIGAVRALWNGRRWGRGPVITWQLLLAVMAVGWLGAQEALWAALLLASTVLVVVGLFLPAVLAATSARGHLPDDGARGTKVG